MPRLIYIMKDGPISFNVVRNLTESEDGIAMVFKEVGKEVLSCVTSGLSSGNDNVVYQVFYILLLRIVQKYY